MVALGNSGALGGEPAIGGADHAAGGRLHRPCLGGAVIVGKKALHRRLCGNVADRAGRDPVGDREDDALVRERGALGNESAVKVLIELFAARG